jgi:hypothetical protein
MIETDINLLNKLDKLEERERLEKEWAELTEQASPEPSFSEVDSSIFEFPPINDIELST